MAKHSAADSARDNFNKLLAANRKSTSRNNVVLMEACAAGKINYIKTSVDAGADVHYTTDDNDTPMLRCCNLSPLEAEKCIKYLMKRGADPNKQDKYGRTVLSYVAEKGNSDMVDILITKCDADPAIEDVKGNTALMYAVRSDSLDIVSTIVGYFLVMNNPIDKQNLVGNTPLLLAAKMGHYECARILVEVGGANINLRDLHSFRTAIDWIRITSPQNVDEFRALDPILVRKKDSRTRRLAGGKAKYRVLSEFFPVGKMPSCWRSGGSKGISMDPRKHNMNRTICIVAEEDSPKPPESEAEPEPSYEEAIDNILNTLSISEASPLPPIDAPPRSMFDIPNLNEPRVTEGRFVDQRCESVMSAPSPTFPLLDDLLPDSPLEEEEEEPDEPRQPLSPVYHRSRRYSLDSSILSRPQTQSPRVRGRRNPRLPLNDNHSLRRIATDPLRNARIPTESLRGGGKISADSIPGTRIAGRTGRNCNSRKTSLPNINKNNHIARANSYVHS